MQQRDAQALACFAQACVRQFKWHAIVLMIARHKENGHRPCGQILAGRKAGQAKIGVVLIDQHRAILIGADVACQDQHIGQRRGFWCEARVSFQMQI